MTRSLPKQDVAELLATGPAMRDARLRATPLDTLQKMLGYMDGRAAHFAHVTGALVARAAIATELERRGELPNLAVEIGRGNHCPHCLCPGHEQRAGNAAPVVARELRRFVNLSAHPLFREQVDLPIWESVVAAARAVLERVNS